VLVLPLTTIFLAVSVPATAGVGVIDGGRLLAQLAAHNQAREHRLLQFSETRTYNVISAGGDVQAAERVLVEYRAPGRKTFSTTFAAGSRAIRSLVFRHLMEIEAATAGGPEQQDSAITPANYYFRFLGEDRVDGRKSYAVEAIPRRNDKYLFDGKVWIDAEDTAVVKIAARPARNPSFWIKHVDFVRTYQKINGFWLPLRDVTTVELRMYGPKVLTVDHRNYVLNYDVTESGR